MRPVLGWKVIEGKQDFFIFLQTFAGLWKFDLVTGDELFVGCQSCFAGRRQVHFMDQLLSFALNTFRHFIQFACSFLEQLFEKRFLFIFSSLTERDQFTFWHWRILSFGVLG